MTRAKPAEEIRRIRNSRSDGEEPGGPGEPFSGDGRGGEAAGGGTG